MGQIYRSVGIIHSISESLRFAKVGGRVPLKYQSKAEVK